MYSITISITLNVKLKAELHVTGNEYEQQHKSI